LYFGFLGVLCALCGNDFDFGVMSKAATGFPPVIDANVETLILGSFPSVASLGKAQYYGHPQNHFWRLVGAVIDEPLYEMEYARRLKTLLKHRIGLWDIIGTCKREGSLDSNIRNPGHNDFSRVTGVAKKLRCVCFNGKTAGKMEPQFIEWGFATIVLPSSSPANTMRFDEKLKQWRQIALPGRSVGRSRARKSGSVFLSSPLTPRGSLSKC
jgi:hypoxanthine-DNA glycosylase